MIGDGRFGHPVSYQLDVFFHAYSCLSPCKPSKDMLLNNREANEHQPVSLKCETGWRRIVG